MSKINIFEKLCFYLFLDFKKNPKSRVKNWIVRFKKNIRMVFHVGSVEFSLRWIVLFGMIKTFSALMLQFYADYDQVEKRIMWFIRFSTFC
jgi:hypothetical protein